MTLSASPERGSVARSKKLANRVAHVPAKSSSPPVLFAFVAAARFGAKESPWKCALGVTLWQVSVDWRAKKKVNEALRPRRSTRARTQRTASHIDVLCLTARTTKQR